MTNRLTITRPDDWHLHLRDGAAIASVLPATAARFGRAIIMPNLKPPVTTLDMALAYRQRILAVLPQTSRFQPLMTLYLTDRTDPAEVLRARASGLVHAVKYYPAGATTHSDSGVTRLEHVYPALAAMQECGLPLLIHGEVTDASVDVFDREARFVTEGLPRILDAFPRLKLVVEHITTRQAVDWVRQAPANVGATITAHHLLLNRNALFAGGVRPHHYCLPVLKREEHRLALVAAATSGNPKYFLGTDCAPHARTTKEADCGCAGCYTAHAGIELYAEAFDAADALDRLEGFASFHGADFYGLPRNVERITLVKESWQVERELPYLKGDGIVPLRAGESIAWRIESVA